MSDGVVFNRDAVARSSTAAMDMAEIWDDTELIKMYEESVSATYSKIDMSTSKTISTEENKWRVGSRCIAPFYDDDQWYPAQIMVIDEQKGQAEVLFDGYGNQEWVDIVDLRGEKDFSPDGDLVDGDGAFMMDTKIETEKKAEGSESASEGGSQQNRHRRSNLYRKHTLPKQGGGPFRSPIPSIAPPPLPSFSDLSSPSEMEALSSMLMSWYMSGYHTGYFQALNDAKRKK